MTTIRLYELADAREILETWLAESEGELTPELEALLADLNGRADEKIERVALFIREQIARAEASKHEEQRLSARRKSCERAAESLKDYLAREMQRLGKERVNGLLATIAFQRNPPAVKGEVDAAALWDASDDEGAHAWRPLLKYIPEQIVLDRRAVLDAHKAGQPIPDGLTVEQGMSLRIR